MNLKVLVAVILIAAGVFALVYKGFDYTEKEEVLKLGPLQASADMQKRYEIPTWAGITLIAGGVVILVFFRK